MARCTVARAGIGMSITTSLSTSCEPVGGYAAISSSLQMQLSQRQAGSPPAACSIIPSIFDFCESASPGFSAFSPASKAPCLCYSFSSTSTAWVPEYFDGVILTCAEYVKTKDPTDYTVYQAMENFCTSVGDVLATTTTATAAQTTAQSTTTAPSTATTAQETAQPTDTGPITAAAAMTGGNINNSACTSVVNILASCIAATPAFRTLPNTEQASCACYSGDAYDPNGFDAPILSCANYASTADPAYYSDIASLTGFCASYYGGLSSQTSAASTPAITSPSKTTIVIYPPPGTTSISQTTVSVKTSVGSSSRGGGSRDLLWVLIVVALEMILPF
ncbi:hypothetical protein N431DRAFT_547684 [Stipitochalara longipes BDJ]|nr:hypothetical protein N431DRAFT_547684 [Stipitochalara longipes BDJ]